MDYEREFSDVVTSPVPLETLIEWCRTPASRLCWPGASDVRTQGSVYYYTLNMQAPGGPQAKGMIEEYVGAVQPSEKGGSAYTSMITLTWPSGEVGSGQQSWSFEADPATGASTFSWDMAYVLPRKFGTFRLNRDRFLVAIDRALSLYVSRLANGPRSAEEVAKSAAAS